jgi:hypothetical protein
MKHGPGMMHQEVEASTAGGMTAALAKCPQSMCGRHRSCLMHEPNEIQ